MIAEFPKNLIRVGLLLTPLAFVPSVLNAQEPTEPEACIASVEVASIPSGAESTAVSFSFSQEIGEVTGIEGGESGLQIASSDDSEHTEMASEVVSEATEMASEATEMASELTGSAVIWLNTLEATPGTYEVQLVTEQGTCTAEVTVGDPA